MFAQSERRVEKERAMRRRRLRNYLNNLKAMKSRKRPLTRDALNQALGAAKKEAGRDARFLKVIIEEVAEVAETVSQGTDNKGKPKTEAKERPVTLNWTIDRKKLREARRREGRYLLRTNLGDEDPAKLWELYLQLTEVEQAFKEPRGHLAVRPVYHQLERRIESHIFTSFLAYCLQVILNVRLKRQAGGLTPRAVPEKFATVQMIDVHMPTSDGREIVMLLYTQPDLGAATVDGWNGTGVASATPTQDHPAREVKANRTGDELFRFVARTF